MEKIDLNNYEAYFLDYMEGTLSAEEKHDLFAFLEEHPELKAEMEEDFGGIELIPEKIAFDAKADLKIDERKLILTPVTVEELMIASVEGQLTETHNKELAEYIKANQLEKTFAYYQATILKPDTSLVFGEKEKLKQKGGVVIPMRFVARLAAVAAVGAILITVALNWNGSDPINSGSGEGIILAHDVKGPNQSSEEKSPSDFNGMTNDMMALEENPVVETPDRQPNRNDFVPNNNIPQNEMAHNEDPVVNDTTNQVPDQHENIPNEDPFDDGNDIVREDGEKPDESNPNRELEIPEEEIITDEIAVASVKREEPYKLVTEAASDLVNRDVQFTRDRDLASNDYVAYSFKLGKFEFERKKSR